MVAGQAKAKPYKSGGTETPGPHPPWPKWHFFSTAAEDSHGWGIQLWCTFCRKWQQNAKWAWTVDSRKFPPDSGLLLRRWAEEMGREVASVQGSQEEEGGKQEKRAFTEHLLCAKHSVIHSPWQAYEAITMTPIIQTAPSGSVGNFSSSTELGLVRLALEPRPWTEILWRRMWTCTDLQWTRQLPWLIRQCFPSGEVHPEQQNPGFLHGKWFILKYYISFQSDLYLTVFPHMP